MPNPILFPSRSTLLFLVLLAGLLIAAAPPEAVVTARFEKIVGQLQKIRFCNSGRCRYRDVRWQVTKATDPKTPYTGLIRAQILRPSGSVDQGRYVFQFRGSHWQLVSGTEQTDVNDTTYVDDGYEVTSAYGRTPIQGRFGSAEDTLETGYKQLYLKILNRGVER